MVVRTIFELESLKDQAALLDSISNHINYADLPDDMDPAYRKLVDKIDRSRKNIRTKTYELQDLLNN